MNYWFNKKGINTLKHFVNTAIKLKQDVSLSEGENWIG